MRTLQPPPDFDSSKSNRPLPKGKSASLPGPRSSHRVRHHQGPDRLPPRGREPLQYPRCTDLRGPADSVPEGLEAVVRPLVHAQRLDVIPPWLKAADHRCDFLPESVSCRCSAPPTDRCRAPPQADPRVAVRQHQGRQGRPGHRHSAPVPGHCPDCHSPGPAHAAQLLLSDIFKTSSFGGLARAGRHLESFCELHFMSNGGPFVIIAGLSGGYPLL